MPYESFPTRDGDVLLGGGNDRLYGVLCRKIGEPQLADDERFVTNELRVKHRETLVPMIAAKTRGKTTQVGGPHPQTLQMLGLTLGVGKEWLRILEGSGIPYAPVNDVHDALAHHHAVAREMVKTVPHPTVGPIRLVDTPVKYSGSTPGIRSPPPTLGQHTDQVLADMAGLQASEMAELRRLGVVS